MRILIVWSNMSSICLVSAVGEVGITFEDLLVSMAVPNGYAGFQWSNMQVCSFNGAQRVSNNNPGPMSFSRMNGTFNLLQTVIFPYIALVDLTVIGLSNNTVAYNQTITLNNTLITIQPFNMVKIDTIIFQMTPQSALPTINLGDILYTL